MVWDSAIFRATNLGQNEGSVETSEKILFNSDDILLNDQIINNTEFDIRRALGKQARIRREFSHKIEDTGFEGIDPIISGTIKTENILEAEYKIKRWLLEDQFTTPLPMGRFGLRLNDNPVFNLTPNAERGYMLERIRLIRPGTHRGKLQFIGFLKFNGAIGTPNNRGEYVW